jgi:hypothetical protein
MNPTGARGAVAGAIAAALWAASEPPLGRAFGTPFSDVRLLGRTVTRGPLWPVVGVAAHMANGALFGWAFARLGGHGAKRGVAAASVENLALWPAMALVDRFHPDRRDGTWPRLVTDPRTFGFEVTTHALFGATLGALVEH